MTIDIDRKATEQTGWSACGNHVVGMLTKMRLLVLELFARVAAPHHFLK